MRSRTDLQLTVDTNRHRDLTSREYDNHDTLLSFTISLSTFPFRRLGSSCRRIPLNRPIRKARMAFWSLIFLTIILWQVATVTAACILQSVFIGRHAGAGYTPGAVRFLDRVSDAVPIWDFSLLLGAVYNNIPVFFM